LPDINAKEGEVAIHNRRSKLPQPSIKKVVLKFMARKGNQRTYSSGITFAPNKALEMILEGDLKLIRRR
jgi:hypothetical protein